MDQVKIAAIWAECKDLDGNWGGIGLNGDLPFKIPEDMAFFRKTTLDSTIIYGKNTFLSFGSKPLPKRNNIVVSRSLTTPSSNDATPSERRGIAAKGNCSTVPAGIGDGISVCSSIPEALELAKGLGKPIFFIGGSKIYKESLPYLDRIYQTRVYTKAKVDTYAPIVPQEFKLSSKSGFLISETGVQYQFLTYRK
jgi:dihydrofolate reductase